MSANPLLSIEGLTASVDEKTILHNVNLNVAAGETHVLMGPQRRRQVHPRPPGHGRPRLHRAGRPHRL